MNQELNEHQKYINDIKSYVISFTSNIPEKREFAINFFNRNKQNHKVYQALIQITENIDESYEIRLQTITILKKVFDKRDFDSYIKVKKNIEEDFEIYKANNHNILAEDSASQKTDEFLKLMLPSGKTDIDFTSEEENLLFSHFGNNVEKNDKKNIKVSIIDSLFYIDQDGSNQKLLDKAKILIKEEMHNLPSIQAYSKLINKHFDKYVCFENRQNEEKIENYHFSEFQNTKNYFNEYSVKLNANPQQRVHGSNLYNFKDKIKTHFENPLPSKLNDEENWKKLISSTSLSMQNFNILNFNLDLYAKYGPLKWKKYIENYDNFIVVLDKEKNSLIEKCKNINRERKLLQVTYQN